MEITLDVYEVSDLKKLIENSVHELERLVQYMDSDIGTTRLKDKIARLKTVLWKLSDQRWKLIWNEINHYIKSSPEKIKKLLKY